jgi:hypothetical protein
MSETPLAKDFLLNISGQLLLARALGIVTDLGIADLVAAGPKSMPDLAEETGCDQDALYRLLRMLGGHGIFAEDEQGYIELTPRAELLQIDHPDSVHDLFVLSWQDIHWNTYQALPEAVMTGEIAFDIAYEKSFFDYLAEFPNLNAVFDRRMAGVSQAENAQVAKVYAFNEHTPVIDIGGGQGGLLAAILAQHPDTTVALYEQPQVLADPASLREAGLLDIVARVAGNFFEEIPSGFGLYVLKRIIHDWDDDQAVRLLRRCREAMSDTSRILVIDAVMQPGNDPDPNKNLDLSIMALTPGRERTEAEFAGLFATAGLRLTRVIATELPSTLSLVEGERVN